MAGNNQQRRRKKRSQSGKTMNRLEVLIFGAMTLYIIVILISYFQSDSIMGYTVQLGSLSEQKTYTGIALREEQTISCTKTGYINYYIREGERVSSRDTVYSIDESGKLAELIASQELSGSEYSNEDLSQLRSQVIQYVSGFDSKDFQSVYDFKYELDGTVVELVNASVYDSIETLNSSSLSNMVTLCSTGKSGYIVYSTDGYEELEAEDISAEAFDQSEYEKTRVNNNDLVEAGTVVGKLVTDENWSLVIPIEEDKIEELEEAEYVEVKFIKTQETSWGKVTILELEDGYYAQLSFTNSCKTFCTDRYVDIELIMDDVTGLKIPKSAIAEKEFFIIPAEYMTKGGENGDYGVSKQFFDEEGNIVYQFVETTVYSSTDEEFYVDDTNLSVGDYICKPDSTETMAVSKSGTLIGVYNMNKGYADFKQITILAENDEYAIVSSNTQYGLVVYDRIVLNAESVNTDDFIYSY